MRTIGMLGGMSSTVTALARMKFRFSCRNNATARSRTESSTRSSSRASSATTPAPPTEIIERLVRAGAQGIILGCTEIELLIGEEDGPGPVFPTTRLHVEAAVHRALD